MSPRATRTDQPWIAEPMQGMVVWARKRHPRWGTAEAAGVAGAAAPGAGVPERQCDGQHPEAPRPDGGPAPAAASAIEIERVGQPELHVFDAKLRVDGVALRDDESEEDEADPLSFKKDVVVKMHAYRDALPHVRSARVLYPGDVAREFPALAPGALTTDDVGAVPLVPVALAPEPRALLPSQ